MFTSERRHYSLKMKMKICLHLIIALLLMKTRTLRTGKKKTRWYHISVSFVTSVSPRNKQTWQSSMIYDTTWSPIPVTIHRFYCHIFKFLFVTNFYLYFHFFNPWRIAFKPKYWAICLNIYCFVLSFCLLIHRLAVRISLPFYIFLQV